MSDEPKPVLSAHLRVNDLSVLFIGITKEAIKLFEQDGAVTMNGDSFGMPGVKILLTPTEGPAEFKAKVTELFRGAGGSRQVMEIIDKSFDPKASS